MQSSLWAARLAFAALVAYGAARVLDPEARWGTALVRGDRVEHGLLVCGLLIALLSAFPRLSVRAAVAAMLGVGLAVEALQALPWIPGGFQWGDLLADAIGVALAAAPFIAGRERGRRQVH